MKISSSVEEKVFDLFALIEQSLKNNFGKDQNRSWKLVILAVGEDKVGEIFRKWFGYSSAKQSLDGVTSVSLDFFPSTNELLFCIVVGIYRNQDHPKSVYSLRTFYQ